MSPSSNPEDDLSLFSYVNYSYLFIPTMCLAVSYVLLGSWTGKALQMLFVILGASGATWNVFCLNPKSSFKAYSIFHFSLETFYMHQGSPHSPIVLIVWVRHLTLSSLNILSFLIQSPNTYWAPTVWQGATLGVASHISLFLYQNQNKQ